MDRVGGKKINGEAFRIVKEEIDNWYHDQGYMLASCLNFNEMESGEIKADVNEGEINDIVVNFNDDRGNSVAPIVPTELIREIVPFKKGNLVHTDDTKKAVQDLMLLREFQSVNIMPVQAVDKEGNYTDMFNIEVNVMQKPNLTTEADLEWNITPAQGDGGKPKGLDFRSLLSVPGGTVFWENNDVGGSSWAANATVSTSDLLDPPNDLDWNFNLVRPMIFGFRDKRRSKLTIGAFNGRSLSPVFSPSHQKDDGGATVNMERSGIKAYVTQNLLPASKVTFGLVGKEVCARDEEGALVTHGVSNTGPFPNVDGPPMTVSPTGRDHAVYFQGKIVRDTTYDDCGATLGHRDQYIVEHGVLGMTFHRVACSFTRFRKLFKAGKTKAPPASLIANASYASTWGDLPAYECRSIGGPASARGYSVAEIATSRQALELSAELRLPVPGTRILATTFVDHGTDLGSSKFVKGNPSQFFNRPGDGTSFGAGVKVGAVRVEYVRDCNNHTGGIFTAFGEKH